MTTPTMDVLDIIRKHAIDCSLDTYIVLSNSFTYSDPLEAAAETATVAANPMLSESYWCPTPKPDDGSVPLDGLGIDAVGGALCDIYQTVVAGGQLDKLLTTTPVAGDTTPTPPADQPATEAPPADTASADTPPADAPATDTPPAPPPPPPPADAATPTPCASFDPACALQH